MRESKVHEENLEKARESFVRKMSGFFLLCHLSMTRHASTITGYRSGEGLMQN